MRPYQDNPQSQLGFILNLEQHWFTLRRFGHAEPKIEADEGNGHWFNLNSFLPEPEWVGREYLKMVLQQSEAEGYSVFVVTQADPEAPMALPRTQADIMASSILESNTAQPTRSDNPEGMEMDLGEEDYELQAALQASLMANSAEPDTSDAIHDSQSSPPHFPGIFASEPASSSSAAQVDDPVQASMERNRLLLERMKREQEFAQRELWSEADLSPEEAAALQERRERRRRQEEEEERELQLAIEASERLAVEGPPPDAIISRQEEEEEDPQLQAALRASLQSAHANTSTHSPTESDSSSDCERSDTQDATTSTIPEKRSTEAHFSVDEMRRKRLERFGM
ncbi:Josephin-domain-containing protein [Panaeolus papilionaceus]|nr:Josephin-domain-containing protein [Panaeolus papilionaceus]